MKAIGFVVTILFVVLIIAQGAYAAPPEPLVFELHGHMTGMDDPVLLGPDANISDPETWKHARISNFTAEGAVIMTDAPDYLSGCNGFSYIESIDINAAQETSTEQGDLTLTCGENETLKIRFIGRADLDFSLYKLFGAVTATVTNQPWTILKGTGALNDVSGQGKRSTFVCAPGAICVRYEGQVNR